MSKPKSRARKPRGQGLVEFALVLPLVLLIVMGIIDFGRLMYIYAAVSNASRDATRVGITEPFDCTKIYNAATGNLSFIAPSDYVVTIKYDSGDVDDVKYSVVWPGGTCASPGSLDPGDRIRVDVVTHVAPLTPIISNLFPDLPLRYESARTVAFAPDDWTPPPAPPPPPPGGTDTATPPVSPTPPQYPNPPTNPRVTGMKCNGGKYANLAWDASVQPPTVAYYTVYKGATVVCTTSGTSCTDNNFDGDEVYYVVATGSNGLNSDPSPMFGGKCGGTSTPTITPIPSATPSPTVTPLPSATPTASRTPTASSTPSPTTSPTITPTPSRTASPTITQTPSRTASPTITQTPSRTPSPTITETPSRTPTPSITPTPSKTPTPTLTSCPPPAVPVLSGSRSKGTVTLSWTAVAGVNSYRVYRSIGSSTGPFTTLMGTYPPGTLSTTDTINKKETRAYIVRSYSSTCGESADSQIIWFYRPNND